MSFRTRLVAALSGMTMLSLGGAFAATWLSVTHAQERQLDDALRAEAFEEASEAESLGGQKLAILDGPGPYASDVGPLLRYSAIFAPDGHLLASTSTFNKCGIPPLSSIRHGAGVVFDFRCGAVKLRGLLVPVPGKGGNLLALAASRADLDRSTSCLARAMKIGFALAVIWVTLVATWVVRLLTRDHQAIASVARRVAAGDLGARVGKRSGDRELAQLAFDIDEMISRLGLLVEAQQRFVANAAHELRSPRTTLYGELTHALRRSRDDGEYRRVIEEALSSTRMLKQLTEDLLELARLGAAQGNETTDLQQLRLLDVARAAAHLVAKEANACGVVVVIEGDDAMVEGHRRDLERMIRNLVENAVRHSPRDSRVQVRSSRNHRAVDLVVTDEGPGVPSKDGERIFEPFFRGSWERANDSASSGLGLSIVRQIAVSHGGSVRLDNDSGRKKGAQFVVTLPLSSPEHAAQRTSLS
ncbi:MAG: ATP-binding protein [Polyangiales bacterium]